MHIQLNFFITIEKNKRKKETLPFYFLISNLRAQYFEYNRPITISISLISRSVDRLVSHVKYFVELRNWLLALSRRRSRKI